MKWLKLGLTALLVLLALLAAAVALVPLLLNSEQLRPRIEAAASEAFGRSTSFASMEWRLFPYPRLVIEDFRLGNPAWAREAYLATAERLQLALALLPLVQGELHARLVAFEGVRVAMEENPAGGSNYDFGPGGGGRLPAIEHFRLRDVIISHTDAGGTRREVTISEGEAWNVIGQPERVRLEGELEGGTLLVEMTATEAYEQLPAGSPWEFEATADLPDLRLTVEGNLGTELGYRQLSGQARLTGSGLASIERLTGASLPAIGDYDFSTGLEAGRNTIAFRALNGRLGPEEQPTLRIRRADASVGERTDTLANVDMEIGGNELGLELSAAPLAELLRGTAPWPLTAVLQVGPTRLTARGTVQGEGASQRVDAALNLTGPNTDGIIELFDIWLPPTADLDLKAQLALDAESIRLQRLGGRIKDLVVLGDTSVEEGDVSISWSGHTELRTGGRAAAGPVRFRWRFGRGGEESPATHDFELQVADAVARYVDFDTSGETLTGSLKLSGADSAVLGRVFDILMPASLPYEAESRLDITDEAARFENLRAVLGRSTATGTLAVLYDDDPVRITGEFRSRLADLGPWLALHEPGGDPGDPAGPVFPELGMHMSVTAERIDGLPQPVGPVTAVLQMQDHRFALSMENFRYGDLPANLDLDLNGTATGPFLELRGRLALGSLRLRAEGNFPNGLDPDGADLDLDASGTNLSAVVPGLAWLAPPDADFGAQLDMHLQGDTYQFTDLSARAGSSRLQGRLTLDNSGPRPRLEGTLRSPLLDLRHLQGAAGEPKPSGKEDKSRLIPDWSLPVEALKSADLQLKLTIDKLHTLAGNAGRIRADLQLRDGDLRLGPVEHYGNAGGHASASLRLDASVNPPTSRLRVDGDNMDLGRLLSRSGVTDILESRVDYRVQLDARGSNRDAFLSSLNGEVSMVMRPGRIGSRRFELWAAPLIRTMLSPEWHREDVTDVNCGAFESRISNGLATIERLLLDTTRMTLAGSGAIDLPREELDLVLAPSPKRTTLLSLARPVTVKGSLAEPRVSVTKMPRTRTLAAGGTVLAGLINPAFLLLAFTERGEGGDACKDIAHLLDRPPEYSAPGEPKAD